MTKRVGVKYLGPVFDGSGYAEFARNFICALSERKDANITVQPVSYEKCRVDHGKQGKIVGSLINKEIDYNVKIINAIPDSLPQYAEKGKKNIAFTMFETSRIPDKWVKCLNEYADACFVPCVWNKQVFEDSGVKIPLYVVPPGVDKHTYEDSDAIQPIRVSNFEEKVIKFYSIFQWTERKNPEGLLKAYWSAFSGREDVCLLLKTYGSDSSPQQQEALKQRIMQLKGQMRLKVYPKVVFIGSMLTKAEMLSLHRSGDCFVLPHRAEGFGLPHIEAMAMGNPVISTGFSGNMDFMNTENSYLLDYQMTPVCRMPWIPYYEGDMMWAEPDLGQLINTMQEIYASLKAGDNIARDKGKLGRKYVLDNFNWQVSARKFMAACKEAIK